jgi:uncharacterized membrane protein
LPTNRLETLADGIFAVAMTILVLEFKVPELGKGMGSKNLASALLQMWPAVLCFVLSFIHLGVFWIGHHSQFHFIKRCNRLLILYNFVFLILIVFLPFTTAIVGRYWNDPLAVQLYGGNVLACGFALYFHWLYANKNKLAEVPEKPLVKLLGARILRGMSFYAAAMALVLIPGFQPVWCLAIFITIPFLYLVPARVDRHFKRA